MTSSSETITRRQASLALGVAWVLFFAPLLFTDGVPFDRDLTQLFIPARQYLRERVLSGRLPGWFPYDGLGTSFIGQIVTATFHPTTWLFLPFSAPVSVKLSLLTLYLAALIGGYRLARIMRTTRVASLAGASAFGFGGYGVGVSNNLPYVLGWATLPWVLWAAIRVVECARSRDAAVLGIVLGSIFLGGDAQGVILGTMLVAAALIIRGANERRVRLLILSGIVAALVMGIELVPALWIARESSRHTVAGADFLGLDWALHPRRLPGFLIPTYTPPMWDGRMGLQVFGGTAFLWSSTIFAGGVAIWLAIVGVFERQRRTYVLAGTVLLFVWLALGHRGGLLRLAWQIVPLLQDFRFPEKYLSAAWVPFCALVAIGFDRVPSLRLRWFLIAAGAGLVLLIGAGIVQTSNVVGWLWSNAGHPLDADDPAREVLRAAWVRGLVTTGAVLMAAALLAHHLRSRRSWTAGLACVVFVELWAGNGTQINLVPPDAFTSENRFADIVHASAPANGPPDRAYHFRVHLIEPNAGDGAQRIYVRDLRLKMLSATGGLDGVSGFGFKMPGNPNRAWSAATTDPERFRLRGPLFNGCFAVTGQDSALQPDETEVLRDPIAELKLVRQPCEPRAYLTPITPVADLAAAWQVIDWDFAHPPRIWEKGPALGGGPGRVQWVRSDDDEVELAVDADAPTALVVNNAYAPGWTAAVDGVPTTIHPANIAVQGIEIPAGHHAVVMSFKTPGLLLGAILTALSLGLAAFLWLVPPDAWRRARGRSVGPGTPRSTG